MSTRRNMARKLVSKGVTGVAKHAFATDRTRRHIFIHSAISEGLATTIGRRHEIELTVDEAIELRDDLSRMIEDVEFHLGGRK